MSSKLHQKRNKKNKVGTKEGIKRKNNNKNEKNPAFFNLQEKNPQTHRKKFSNGL